MTVLPSQIERSNLKIDSYERAILYSAMLLREAVLSDSEANNNSAIRIFTNQKAAKNEVVIEGSLPYNSTSGWLQGGEFFKTILPLASSDPSGLFSTSTSIAPSIEFVVLPAEPAWVSTLENYFIWAIAQAKAYLAQQETPDYQSITYRFFDSRDPAAVDFKVNLPFTLHTWLQERHFLNSLKPLLVPSEEEAPLLPPSLGNDGTLGNDSTLGNEGETLTIKLGNDGTLGNDSTLGNEGEQNNNFSFSNTSNLGNNSTLGN